jgi:predicted translin family RNA/ssDNA-binding protein
VKALVLALAAMLAVGCASGLKPHAQAASVSASVIDSAGDAIEKVAREDFDRAKDTYPTGEELALEIQRLEDKYRPVESAYDALRGTHKAYVDAILKAQAEGKRSLEGERASLIVAAWRELLGVAQSVGINIPGIPQVVFDVIGVSR